MTAKSQDRRTDVRGNSAARVYDHRAYIRKLLGGGGAGSERASVFQAIPA